MAEKTQPAKKPKAPANKAPDVSAYVSILQTQVNMEIQAVKSGALDEELLRAKLVTEMDPSSLNTELTLWLHALAGGLIDNLSVIVGAGAQGPKMDFFPEWDQRGNALAPVLELPVPGPERQVAAGNPALAGGDDSPEVVSAQQG